MWREKRQSTMHETYGSALVGQCVGGINDILPAKDLLLRMVSEAVDTLRTRATQITTVEPIFAAVSRSKL